MDDRQGDVDDKNPKDGMLQVYWDRYGWAAAVSFLGLLAVEMVVLTPLIHFGVDVGPLMRWGYDTFGLGTGQMGPAQPGWIAAIVSAYLVTRVTKPLTWPFCIAMTPLIARWMGTAPVAR